MGEEKGGARLDREMGLSWIWASVSRRGGMTRAGSMLGCWARAVGRVRGFAGLAIGPASGRTRRTHGQTGRVAVGRVPLRKIQQYCASGAWDNGEAAARRYACHSDVWDCRAQSAIDSIWKGKSKGKWWARSELGVVAGPGQRLRLRLRTGDETEGCMGGAGCYQSWQEERSCDHRTSESIEIPCTNPPITFQRRRGFPASCVCHSLPSSQTSRLFGYPQMDAHN